MEREFRISAGAIVFDEGRILLVRYAGQSGTSYLVAPGGGVLIDEGTRHAAAREVLEETGLEILPGKILFVEDLLSKNHRIKASSGAPIRIPRSIDLPMSRTKVGTVVLLKPNCSSMIKVE